MDTFFQSTANIYKKYRLSKIIFNKMPSATEKCVHACKMATKRGDIRQSECLLLYVLDIPDIGGKSLHVHAAIDLNDLAERL